jgi:hypothetical protein
VITLFGGCSPRKVEVEERKEPERWKKSKHKREFITHVLELSFEINVSPNNP